MSTNPLRRMMLIPEQEYARLKAATSNTTSSTINHHLPADLQQKILANSQVEEQRKDRSLAVMQAAPIKGPPMAVSYITAALDKFALQRRKRAHDVFQRVHQNNRLEWDENGEVAIDAKPISGSHLLDLLYFATNTLRQAAGEVPPIGWELFKDMLPPMLQQRGVVLPRVLKRAPEAEQVVRPIKRRAVRKRPASPVPYIPPTPPPPPPAAADKLENWLNLSNVINKA